MKLSKTLVIPVAGLLVVLGAGAVLASTSSSSAANGAPVAPGADTPSSAPASPGTGPKVGPLRVAQDDTLNTVLDGLVAKGTITAAQEQAIKDGLTAERAKQAADRKAKMDALKAQAEQLKGFMSDGTITQDELNKLPADSPIRKLTNLMDDGKITTDELKSLGRGFGGFGGFGRGFGGFGHFGHDKNDSKASPAPSAATGG